MTRLRPFLTNAPGLSRTSKSAHSVDGAVALSDMRGLQVPFRTKLQANFVTANFLISVTNGHKSNDAVFLSGAEELRGAIAALAALKIYSKNCTLVLLLPTDVAVPVPLRIPAPTNPG